MWIPVEGYEDFYRVSSDGEVFSLRTDRLLKKSVCSGGYLGITLSVGGKRKTAQIHRLVAESFIPNPENKRSVNHIDGNRFNNSVNNLEWVTSKENTHHAIRIGLMNVSGEAHPFYGKTHTDDTKRKMSEAKLGKCGDLHPRSTKIAKIDVATGSVLGIYESQCLAAKELNMSQGTLNMALRGLRKTAGGFKWEYV